MNIFKDIKQNYISFDIFDTLLYRDVPIEEIFNITGKKLIKINSEKFQNFKYDRIKTEKMARKILKKEEINIYDIYKQMNLNEELMQIAVEKEIETEIEHLHPNLLLIDRLKILKKNGKKILISSDMYLTFKHIQKILNHFNIPYDYLFVSADIQARKGNGKLFLHEKEKINIKSKEMLHIGDNLKSDVIIPSLLGIKSIHWKDTDLHMAPLKNMNTENSKKLLDILYSYNCSSYFEYIGFGMMGPLLYEYCNWINKKNIQKNLDGLVFLSCDGEIIKKAYDRLYPNDYKYFLVSRRTVTVPLLIYTNNIKDILKVVPHIKRNETIKDFLSKIGIHDNELENILTEKFGNNISRSKLNSDNGKEIYNIVLDKMKKNAQKELEATKLYIEENLQRGKNGLIDLGWRGTIQNSLDILCKQWSHDYEFYGLYLGNIKRKDGSKVNGEGFIYNGTTKDKAGIIDGFNGLIEIMFTANHGTAKKYYIENGVAICELEKENVEYCDFVKKVQEGALKFIDFIMENKIDLSIDSFTAFSALEDFLKNPTIHECYLLGDMKFHDEYFESIIQFNGWKDIIFHPRKSIKLFLKSNWKIGYIKEMFPKFNPEIIFRFINKIK